LPTVILQQPFRAYAPADYLGVEYMYKAGYDPQAFIAFFEKIEALEKHKPGTIARAFSTHPQTPDRIEKTEEEINTLLPPRAEYRLDTSEFEEVKARLAELENRHQLNHPQENRPSLRRASNRGGTASGDSSSDDGRPTLKRRPDDNPQ
jgi:predicted Zn-dependent protease